MNKEDLQQIAELMDAKFSPIKSDIAGMKGDIAGMKGDIAGMKGDIATMKGDIATLKDDTRQTRVLVEQRQYKLQLIIDQYADIAEKLDKVNERTAQMDDFQARLRAVELAVMRHEAILKKAQ